MLFEKIHFPYRWLAVRLCLPANSGDFDLSDRVDTEQKPMVHSGQNLVQYFPDFARLVFVRFWHVCKFGGDLSRNWRVNLDV